jgi:hypothetical protein
MMHFLLSSPWFSILSELMSELQAIKDAQHSQAPNLYDNEERDEYERVLCPLNLGLDFGT